MVCPECNVEFTPDRFFDCCNQCGDKLSRQYERIQHFDDSDMTMALITSRCLFGKTPKWRRAWVIG